jgi:hypothetical protein
MMTKYYVMAKDALGQRAVISDRQGRPADMTGVDVVDLPAGDYLTVISKGREFPASKVARAVVAGQIAIDDIRA